MIDPAVAVSKGRTENATPDENPVLPEDGRDGLEMIAPGAGDGREPQAGGIASRHFQLTSLAKLVQEFQVWRDEGIAEFRLAHGHDQVSIHLRCSCGYWL